MDNSLSIISLILSAGFVVQVVMFILVLMSVYSWTLILSKKKTLMDAKNDIKVFHNHFLADTNLDKLHTEIPEIVSDRTPMEHIFGSGYGEFTHSKSTSNQSLVMNSERAYRSMNTTANNEIDRLDGGLSILAMIASSSPYIGLFGTVWGIMNSFQSIAISRNTSLAIVAPGIAEALFATALGLLAAIPAVVAYNKFNSDSQRYFSKIENFSKRFLSII